MRQAYKPVVIIHDKSRLIEKEPFDNIGYESIMKEIKYFDNSKIDSTKAIQLLTRIIYLQNQGIQFDKQDQDILFFKITKLYKSEDYVIRRILVILLKDLITQQNSFILSSCITKDIASRDIQFKLNALKIIPSINDQNNSLQIMELLQNAIEDQNPLISNSALVTTFKLFQKCPYIIKKCQKQILSNLKQEKRFNNYLALILLNKISCRNQFNDFNFIKLLYENIKVEGTPLFKVHLIKFMKGQMNNEKCEIMKYQRDFINFFCKELENSNQMVSLEAAKALISIQQLNSKNYIILTCFLKQQFEIDNNPINRHFILSLYRKISSDSYKVKSLNEMQVSFIKDQCYNQCISLSSVAIQITLNIQHLKKVNDVFSQLYLTASLAQKINFLYGLNEFLWNNFRMVKLFDVFVQQCFGLINDYEQMKAAIDFLQTYKQVSIKQEEISIKLLLGYANSNIIQVKYAVIRLIRKQFSQFCPLMDENEIEEEIENLQKYYNEYYSKRITSKGTKDDLELALQYQKYITSSEVLKVDEMNGRQNVKENTHLIEQVQY